jgi:DNA-binding NarL/FixJ family response regulator
VSASLADAAWWKPEQEWPLLAPGTPLSDEQAALIWRELAAGRWEVRAAIDANGSRHVAITPVASKQGVDWGALGPRERRVVGLLAGGLAQKTVAMELGISPSAVSTALHAARARLGFGSASELVSAYRSAGDVEVASQ